MYRRHSRFILEIATKPQRGDIPPCSSSSGHFFAEGGYPPSNTAGGGISPPNSTEGWGGISPPNVLESKIEEMLIETVSS